MKETEVKEPVLKQPSVTEFADAFCIVKDVVHSGDDGIGDHFASACAKIGQEFLPDPDKMTKEQAFTMFDRFLFMSAILYAYVLKNPKEGK